MLSKDARVVVDVQLAGLPGTQAVPQVFGKAFRIGRGEKGIAGDPPGCLVMAVAVAGRIGEHGYDHVGTKTSDDAYHVRKQHFIMIPVFQGLLGRLGKPEVVSPREELLRAIETPGRQQLFRPDHADGVVELGTDEVLSAFRPG